MKRKPPADGERVRVYDVWTDTYLEGTVDGQLSIQFAWNSDDGRRFITHNDGLWEKVDASDVTSSDNADGGRGDGDD